MTGLSLSFSLLMPLLSSLKKELDAAKSGNYFRVIPIDLGQLQHQPGDGDGDAAGLSEAHCGLHLLCAFLPSAEPADLGKEAAAALKLIRWKPNEEEKEDEFLVKAHLIPKLDETDVIFISEVV